MAWKALQRMWKDAAAPLPLVPYAGSCFQWENPVVRYLHSDKRQTDKLESSWWTVEHLSARYFPREPALAGGGGCLHPSGVHKHTLKRMQMQLCACAGRWISNCLPTVQLQRRWYVTVEGFKWGDFMRTKLVQHLQKCVWPSEPPRENYPSSPPLLKDLHVVAPGCTCKKVMKVASASIERELESYFLTSAQLPSRCTERSWFSDLSALVRWSWFLQGDYLWRLTITHTHTLTTATRVSGSCFLKKVRCWEKHPTSPNFLQNLR